MTLLALLSPAKTLDETPFEADYATTIPDFATHALELVDILKTYDAAALSKLMGLSEKLSQLNQARYQVFSSAYHLKNSKPALFMLKGDVYQSLDAQSLSPAEVRRAHTQLAILSGLYGILRPLDLMQPYRLEMGTKLANVRGKNLYAFWGDRLSQWLNQHPAKVIVNLASQEYAGAIDQKTLQKPWIDVQFKEKAGVQYRTIGIHAKKARGWMARYLITHNIQEAQDIKAFSVEGYGFNAALSDATLFTFTRG